MNVAAWNVDTQYMFGPDILVAPVMEAGVTVRDVYLPEGSCWTNLWSGEVFEGGQTIAVSTPMEQIPVFTRNEELRLTLMK